MMPHALRASPARTNPADTAIVAALCVAALAAYLLAAIPSVWTARLGVNQFQDDAFYYLVPAKHFLQEISTFCQQHSADAALRSLMETLEYQRQVTALHAFARVSNSQIHELALSGQLHPHVSSGWREFDGIRQKIAEHLLHSASVTVDGTGLFWWIEDEFDSLVSGRMCERFHRLVRHRSEHERANVELQLASDDSRYVEQIFNQLSLRPGIAFDNLNRAFRADAFQLVGRQHARPAEHGVERRPEFV